MSIIFILEKMSLLTEKIKNRNTSHWTLDIGRRGESNGAPFDYRKIM